MGYYSEVALVLTRTGKEYLDKKLLDSSTSEKARDEATRLLAYADTHSINETGAEAWLWKDIKWYSDWTEDFPEVAFIEKLMGELDGNEFYFVRVGEEIGDNEIRGLWWENPFGMRLCREVVLDC